MRHPEVGATMSRLQSLLSAVISSTPLVNAGVITPLPIDSVIGFYTYENDGMYTQAYLLPISLVSLS